MTAFFLVNRFSPQATTATALAYKGIDRSPWECVDALYHAGRLSADLTAKRRASFNNPIGNLSFGTVASVQEVRDLAAACGSASSIGVVLVVSPVGILDQLVGDHTCKISLGFDAYVDGYGSLITLGILQSAEAFQELTSRMTQSGLFASLNDLREYWQRYLAVSTELDLEPLFDVGPVWVYDVVEEISL